MKPGASGARWSPCSAYRRPTSATCYPAKATCSMRTKNTSKAAKVAPAPAIKIPSEPTRLASRTREETWPIGRLKPYERNAREHSQSQIDQIRASYREFGEVQRVVVDEAGELIAGHGRHQALLQENVSEVRVAVAVDWTADQKRRF